MAVFDNDLWLYRILGAAEGRVPCSAPMAQEAAEHCFGRALTIHAFRPEPAFSACLLAPDGQRVTGGQARGPWAIIPEWTAHGRLMPVLHRLREGAMPWLRVAMLTQASAAVTAAKALHRAEGWVRPTFSTVDVRAVEQVLLAARLMPGRVAGSSERVYAPVKPRPGPPRDEAEARP